MIHSKSVLVILVTSSLLGSSANGAVLKDHVSTLTLFDGLPLINQGYPPSSPQGASGAATAFTGDGNVLSTVGAIFAHEDPFGNVNGGSPQALDFRFSFFDDSVAYTADPFLESPSPPSTFHLLDTVSNLGDWLTPVGQSSLGHSYFYWEFDVGFLGITTTPGEEHLVSIVPEENFQSGPTFMAFSMGGPTAIGAELDWLTSRPAGFAPNTLQDLGAPHDFAAYKVVTVPEPLSFCLLLVLAGLVHANKPSAKAAV